MNKIKSTALIGLGTMITGFAISTFLAPNKVVCGGVSGISTILYQTLSLAPGATFAVINAILLLLGGRMLGREFTLKTIAGVGSLSFFVQLFSYIPPATDDVLLAAVFGGMLYGTGIAIAFIAGASTGGTDILSRIIQHCFPRFPIGKLLMVVDGAVIITSLTVFKERNLALFGIISLFISTYSVDRLIQRLNLSKIAFIITEKGEEMSKMLVSGSPRGVTLLDAVGAYSEKKKNLLFCALKEGEVSAFQRKIFNFDKNAFIVYAESQQIMGNGFYIYR